MIFKKKFAYYVPCKDDAVDEALGNYINREPRNELRIMFVRVGPSTYYFGNQLIKVAISRYVKVSSMKDSPQKVDDFTAIDNPAQISVCFGNHEMDIEKFLK